jgi:hypothetical protein
MKKTAILCIILFAQFVPFCFVQNVDLDGVRITEELVNEDKIRITIIYDNTGENTYIHIGINGWQQIMDIKMDYAKAEIVLPRNTAQVDLCFNVDGVWHNNYGKDWSLRLKNFVSDSFFADLGDDMAKVDYLKQKYSEIIDGIEYLQKNKDISEFNRRSLNTLYYLKDFAEELLPAIMKKKDFEDRKKVKEDFDYFVKMTEGL